MAAATVLFVKLTGAFFAFGRRFFLKDTGRKLAHFDRELNAGRSGRTVARSGLRMMPTFPPSPLSFRTAGFPQYGCKAGLSDSAFAHVPLVKPAPGILSGSLALPLSFVHRA